MGIPPELLKIPVAFLESGDPEDRNPFRNGHLLHTAWADATKRAAESEARLNARYLGESDFAAVMDPALAGSRYIRVVVQKFDIWSHRTMLVVQDDAQVQKFTEWLVGYAEKWLNTAAQGCQRIQLDPAPVLSFLRTELSGRIEHWKAEAYAYRAAQVEHQQTARASGAEESARHVPNGELLSEASPTRERRLDKQDGRSKQTVLGANLDGLKRLCDVTLEEIAQATDRSTDAVSDNVNGLTRPRPGGLTEYASFFTSRLEISIEPADLDDPSLLEQVDATLMKRRAEPRPKSDN